MAQQMKVPGAKAYDLSSIPGTHMVKEKRNSHPTHTLWHSCRNTHKNKCFNEEPKVGSQTCEPNPLEQKQRGKPLWSEAEMGKTFLTISHHYDGERKAKCTTGNKCLSVSQILLSQMAVVPNEAMIINAYPLVLVFAKFSSFLEQSFSNLNHLGVWLKCKLYFSRLRGAIVYSYTSNKLSANAKTATFWTVLWIARCKTSFSFPF